MKSKTTVFALLCAAALLSMPALWAGARGMPVTAGVYAMTAAPHAPPIARQPAHQGGGALVLAPSSPGTQAFRAGGAVVDASNCNEGYVTVSCQSGARVKVQVTKNGGAPYTYNLNNSGGYEVFPLTMGDGSYKIGVYENVSGDQYAEALAVHIDVALRGQTLPFLYPSQYVNFNAGSATVAKGRELAVGAKNDLEIIANVYNYVIQNIAYDTAKAQTVQKGYLPVVDNVLSSGKGICFDYAAVMAAMLRSQQIPTRLEVGYISNGAYHAWISAYIAETGWVNGIIYFDGKSWKLLDPTFAAGAGQGDATLQYIGNGKNYRAQYLY